MLHLQFQNGLDHNFWLSHPTPLRDFVLPHDFSHQPLPPGQSLLGAPQCLKQTS